MCRSYMKTHRHRCTILLLFMAIISPHSAYPEQGRSPQTQYVFTRETGRLNCSIQPRQASSLYSVVWGQDGTRIDGTNFSLSVPVRNVSQNGTVYQCTVTVQSCSPVSLDRCAAAREFASGDPITLLVGGKCILTNRSSTP